ncbi:MAG TPA: hypothetical protein VGU27_10380 [Candidatus Eisenbacteria bacterium]|nr:hypothetical protein [Candidatus Eisenbacteria bacterium]
MGSPFAIQGRARFGASLAIPLLALAAASAQAPPATALPLVAGLSGQVEVMRVADFGAARAGAQAADSDATVPPRPAPTLQQRLDQAPLSNTPERFAPPYGGFPDHNHNGIPDYYEFPHPARQYRTLADALAHRRGKRKTDLLDGGCVIGPATVGLSDSVRLVILNRFRSTDEPPPLVMNSHGQPDTTMEKEDFTIPTNTWKWHPRSAGLFVIQVVLDSDTLYARIVVASGGRR